MSNDYADMPEEGSVMHQAQNMDIASFSHTASSADEDPYNKMPHEEAHEEEKGVEDLFMDLGAPPAPAAPLPLWLQHKQNVAQFQQQIDASRMEFKPGMLNMIGQAYHLEKHDPRHRFGAVLESLLPYWKNGHENAEGQGFFQWLDGLSYQQLYNLLMHIARNWDNPASWVSQNIDMMMKGVEYLDAVSRRHYQVMLSTRRNCMLWNNRPLNTASLSTVFSGKGWGCWVLSASGKFYTGPHIKGEFHHSSFLSGGHVKAAGEWKVEEGRLKTITGKTGHYQSPISALLEALVHLQKSIGLGGAYVNVWELDDQLHSDPQKQYDHLQKMGKKKATEFPAIAFISNPVMQEYYQSWGKTTRHTPVH